MPLVEKVKHGVVYMTSPNIEATHVFTTRFRGVSRGIYSSLNLGLNCGDDPTRVRYNYRLVCRTLGITDDDIVCSNQVHGAHIRVVTRDDRKGLYAPSPHSADGLLTRETGVALTVFTADCVPILLHDPVCGVIGAVHAGWRGTVAGVADVAVQKMVYEFGCFPSDIRAAIGPCISKCCYETGRDVADALNDILNKKACNCIEACGERYMVDLKEANRLLLSKAGLVDIVVSDECTS